MSEVSDILADIFVLAQNLMKHQTKIDTALKDLDLDFQDFDVIENASAEIIETCQKIEKRLMPRTSCCCQT